MRKILLPPFFKTGQSDFKKQPLFVQIFCKLFDLNNAVFFLFIPFYSNLVFMWPADIYQIQS